MESLNSQISFFLEMKDHLYQVLVSTVCSYALGSVSTLLVCVDTCYKIFL